MPLLLNVRHLEAHSLRLLGELAAGDLGLAGIDELVRPSGPLRYDFLAERHERGILLQGRLELELQCECARCLRTFGCSLALPAWVCLLPWEGEDRVPVTNDCVDLTPYLREDMILALPQRPLCQPECEGLPGRPAAWAGKPSAATLSETASSAWAALNKLRF